MNGHIAQPPRLSLGWGRLAFLIAAAALLKSATAGSTWFWF